MGNDVEFVSMSTVPEEIDKEAKPLIVVRQKGGKLLSPISCAMTFIFADLIP